MYIYIHICVYKHPLTCSYLEPSGEEKKVRQYFKFQVQKPLSVTTKLHLLNNTILLENQARPNLSYYSSNLSYYSATTSLI